VKALPVSLAIAAILGGALACRHGPILGFDIPSHDELALGGVYVAYNLGCEKGCNLVEKGDLIVAIDDQPVQSGQDFDRARVARGTLVRMTLRKRHTHALETVEIMAKPNQNVPPIRDAPPFWTVGAAELDRAPAWARRRLFGHAMPMIQLTNVNGGIVDGRQLYGTKNLMVFWDWSTREDQGEAIELMRVLQKAQADLTAKGVDVLFVHHVFPASRMRPMNDTDLRAFQARWSETQPDGLPYDPVPTYRFPNKTEFNVARERGLENAYTVIENLTESPAIVVSDERGIIRWFSQNITIPPEDAMIQDPEQYTLISAVTFALEAL